MGVGQILVARVLRLSTFLSLRKLGSVRVGRWVGGGGFSITSSAAPDCLGAWNLWPQEGCLCPELLRISLSWAAGMLPSGYLQALCSTSRKSVTCIWL